MRTASITCVLVVALSLVHCNRIYRDPALIQRIPKHVRDSIDAVVEERVRRAVSTHFGDEDDDYFVKNRQKALNDVLERERRDVDNSTSNSTAEAIYSPWTDFGSCTAKCGGGVQVRSRTCLYGNCTSSNSEVRECGTLPCVSGTYVLTSITALSRIPMEGAKSFKIFRIKGLRFFGYITASLLTISKWNPLTNVFEFHQSIPVTQGISFDLMSTYPRFYLVVIEKAISIFPGRFSKMYYYNPILTKFDATQAISFDVWNPSAVKTFDVFGKPFMALVNYETKVSTDYGFDKEALICDGQSRTVSCPTGTIISIKKTFYGRVSAWECAANMDFLLVANQYYNWCVIPGVKERISQLCDNKESCLLTAQSSLLTNLDSCLQTNKYLKISYSCGRVSYMGAPIFYRWDGIGLSLVSGEKLVTYGAKDVEAFSIHNQNYVAVANYINDQKSHHLDSEVYVYNLHSGRFQNLQRIRTDGAVDWEFFKVGEGLAQEYFLAVANHVKVLHNGITTFEVESVIYKWNWNLFVPFQCFKTYGAVKWTAITGINGEFILSIVNKYGNTTFYAYDGWRFYQTKIQPMDPIFKNAQSLQSFLQHDQTMLIVQNEAVNASNTYQISFMQTFPKYELLEETLLAVEKLNRTVYEELIPQVKAFNVTYEAVKEDIVFVDKDFNITDHKLFRTLSVDNTTYVQTATVEEVNLSPAELDLKRRQDIVAFLIEKHRTDVVVANSLLNRTVTISTDQVINSVKTFVNVSASTLNLSGAIDINGTLNDVNLSELNDNALYINENATITAKFTFNESTVLKRDLMVTGLLNDMNPDEVITIDRDELIVGYKTFQGANFISRTKVPDLTVDGFVNGMQLDQFFTVTGNQTIDVPFTFNNTVIVRGNAEVTATVNKMDLSTVASDAVLINEENATISAEKYFKHADFTGNLDMKPLATINAVDVSEINKHGIHLGADDIINSSLVFMSNVSFLGPVTVQGSVNNDSVHDVVYLNVPGIITGKKHFENDLKLEAPLTVDGTVNNVNISGDVLDRINSQTITGVKTFTSDLTIKGDLQTTGLVDNVDVSEAYADSILMNTTQNITGYKQINNLTVSTLDIKMCDYDCALLDVLTKLKYQTARNGSVVVINGTKTFVNGMTVNADINVDGMVNGIKLPADLLLQGGNKTLSGYNVFQENVTIYGHINLTTINNVSISDLYETAWRKTENITLTGNKTFTDDVYFGGNLDVYENIDGIKFEDVVLSSTNQTVTGNKTFKADTYVYDLSVHNMTTYGFIDGVNLTDLNEELVKLSGDVIIKGTKVFTNEVSFAGNWTIAGLIDGVNITELDQTAMRLEGDQVVTGLKTFTSSVEVGDELTVSELVDGVNLTELSLFAILRDGDEYNVTGNITFDHVTVTDSIKVDGLINQQNLSEIVNDTLKNYGDQVVTGSHTVSHLHTTQNFDVEETVNDIEFAEQVIPLNESIVVTGTKTFTEDIRTNNIDVDYINGINLQNFSRRVLKVNEDANITGYFTFNSELSLDNNLTVNGLINTVNITDIVSTTLTKHGDQTVFVPTVFTNVIFANDIVNSESFNGINLTEFSKNVFYKCYGKNGNISANYTFHDVVLEGGLDTEDLTVSGLINNLDLHQLQQEIVTIYGRHNITGKKRVLGFLSTVNLDADTINGYKVPDDFILLTRNETITGKKIFSDDLSVLNDVTIADGKTVNGYDLSEFKHNIVLLNDSDTVVSPVEFLNTTVVAKNLIVSTINSVNISASKLLLSNGNQTVVGSKTFLAVHSEKDIISANDVQGFDLHKMETETVLSGRQNTISGKKTIVGNVTVTGNVETNFVDDANVTTLFSGFNKISNFLDRDLVHLNKTIALHKKIISQLSDSIDNIHQNIEYFTEEQRIFLPYISISMDVLVDQNKTWLAIPALSDVDGRSCTNSSVYTKAYDGNFTIHTVVLGNAVTNVELIKKNGLYLVSSSNKINDGCFPTLPVANELSMTYQYNNNTNTFDQLTQVNTSKAAFVNTFMKGDDTLMLYTNTYNKNNHSTCVNQSLYLFETNTYTLSASVPACDVIKSIVIDNSAEVTTIAILRRSFVVEIYDIYTNSTQHLKQTIPTFSASDVTLFSTSFGTFLAIANTYQTSTEALATSYSVPVSVYSKTSDGMFTHYQDIDVASAIRVKSFELGVYSYLAIAKYNQEILILKHKGIGKWVTELTIPIQGLGGIKDFKLWKAFDDVYLAVLSNDQWIEKFPSKVRVMKAVLSTAVEGSVVKEKLQQ